MLEDVWHYDVFGLRKAVAVCFHEVFVTLFGKFEDSSELFHNIRIRG